MSIRTLLVGSATLGPYHVARFNALTAAGLDLTVLQTPVREHYRPWAADLSDAVFHVEQPFHGSESLGWQSLLGFTRTYLESSEPQAVMCVGYNRKYVWSVAFCCRRLGIPVVMLLVGWEQERPRVFWKEWAKHLFCERFFTAAVATGSRAADYAQKLGIPPAHIWIAGNVVDNEHFSRPLGSADSLAGSNLPPHFLTVARLSAEKNFPSLLTAFAAYRNRGGTWHLRIAGTGPEEEDLKDLVPPTCRDFVHWLGWKQHEDLPALYAAASCFVLPSLIEPWGLVVNEAMAAGLPVLVSRQCGCLPELCRRGVNGYDFDPLDTLALADLMLEMSSDHVDLAAMGQASRVLIAPYSLDYWSKTVVDCLQYICHLKETRGRVRSAWEGTNCE